MNGDMRQRNCISVICVTTITTCRLGWVTDMGVKPSVLGRTVFRFWERQVDWPMAELSRTEPFANHRATCPGLFPTRRAQRSLRPRRA